MVDLFFSSSPHVNVFEQMQELWEGDMALTVAKSLPAGLHLSNTLTGEMITGGMCGGVEDNCIIIDGCDTFFFFTDDEVSLYAAGIHTNSDLFVWNGKEVKAKPCNGKKRFFFPSSTPALNSLGLWCNYPDWSRVGASVVDRGPPFPGRCGVFRGGGRGREQRRKRRF